MLLEGEWSLLASKETLADNVTGFKFLDKNTSVFGPDNNRQKGQYICSRPFKRMKREKSYELFDRIDFLDVDSLSGGGMFETLVEATKKIRS